MDSILASIEVPANVNDAMQIWSERAAPSRRRQVDFDPISGSVSRVTVRLARRPTREAQSELEQELAAFLRLAERRAAEALRGHREP